MLFFIVSFFKKLFVIPLVCSRIVTQTRVVTGIACAVIFLSLCHISLFLTGILLIVLLTGILYELGNTHSSWKNPTIGLVLATFCLHIMMILKNNALLTLTSAYVAILHDCGGYIAGNLYGKHKIAPKLSPRKTIEGFLGSLVFVGCGILLLQWYYSEYISFEWYDIPILTTLSLWGDLLFSKIKRDSNIKDFSNILPGHGGLSDRIDSIVLITWYIAWILINNN